MVYHEIRKVNGKIKNYLVHGERAKGKIIKESKFIGYGSMTSDKIKDEKEKFERNIVLDKKTLYIDKDKVKEIEELKGRYEKTLKSLAKEELEQFEKNFFIELTYNSNAIEGNSMSLAETSLVLNDGLTPEGKTLREIHEAKNHKEALEFINNYRQDIDELFILKVHSMILRNISEHFAGRYRETNVKVFGSDTNFPDADKVQQLMKNILYWYEKNKKELNQFELAVIFSMKLVTIHPFIDGNGRVSRLIMNYLLRKNGYPWINVYNKQRKEYLNAVKKANEEDYGEIIDFMIRTLKENLESFKI